MAVADTGPGATDGPRSESPSDGKTLEGAQRLLLVTYGEGADNCPVLWTLGVDRGVPRPLRGLLRRGDPNGFERSKSRID